MISNTATNWPLSSVSLCSLTFNFSRRKNRILSEFDEVINTTSSQWRSSISNFPATRNFDKCSSIQNTMYGRSKILWQKNPNSKLLNYKLKNKACEAWKVLIYPITKLLHWRDPPLHSILFSIKFEIYIKLNEYSDHLFSFNNNKVT